jgi:hypothetical protein
MLLCTFLAWEKREFPNHAKKPKSAFWKYFAPQFRTFYGTLCCSYPGRSARFSRIGFLYTRLVLGFWNRYFEPSFRLHQRVHVEEKLTNRIRLEFFNKQATARSVVVIFLLVFIYETSVTSSMFLCGNVCAFFATIAGAMMSTYHQTTQKSNEQPRIEMESVFLREVTF